MTLRAVVKFPSAIISPGLGAPRTRGFAQLVTAAGTMITKPDSPPPFLVEGIRRKRHVLPATWMRAGTSKGLFIHRKYLPSQQELWSPWILAAMGSRNGDPRQLNGIGGATSTTSKVAIVSPSQTPGIDVEYTFAQVAVGKQKVDYSGNCGNIASGVGPFAVEEGIVKAKPGQNSIDVRILNTNTGRVLVETVAVDEDGLLLEQGNYQMAGVSDPGAEIKVAFVDPAGSMTGMLFPTGRTEDTITVEDPTALERPFSVQATLIDAANPFVIVDAQTLPSAFLQGSEEWLETIEDIRREGAVMMGLANSVEEAALTRGTPKIMMVSSPNTLNGYGKVDSTPDISVLSMSMGQIHPSVQLTGAVCLAGASCIEGTVAHRHCRSAELLDAFGVQPIKHGFQSPKTIMIGHRSGQIPVGVHLQDQGALERCIVSRTARRLFEGNVLFYA